MRELMNSRLSLAMNREPSPVRVDTSQPTGARPSPPRRQMSRQFSRQSVFDQISPVFQKQLSQLYGGTKPEEGQKKEEKPDPHPVRPTVAIPVPPSTNSAGGVPQPPPPPPPPPGVSTQDWNAQTREAEALTSDAPKEQVYQSVVDGGESSAAVAQTDSAAGDENLRLQVEQRDASAQAAYASFRVHSPPTLRTQTQQVFTTQGQGQISPGSEASNSSTIRMFMQNSPTSVYSPSSAAVATPTYSSSGIIQVHDVTFVCFLSL